jgi:hypothetical protein
LPRIKCRANLCVFEAVLEKGFLKAVSPYRAKGISRKNVVYRETNYCG